jgi:hypothetical protein
MDKNTDFISDWFWNIIARAEKNQEKLREILASLKKRDLIKFQESFLDASLELQDEPFIQYMVKSEDGVADIAHWVVSQGKEYYLEILANPSKIPFQKDESDSENLFYIADEVCEERFGEDTGIF